MFENQRRKADPGNDLQQRQKKAERISMKERTGRHSASGYALRSVAAEEGGRKSTLSREVFSLDDPDHLPRGLSSQPG